MTSPLSELPDVVIGYHPPRCQAARTCDGCERAPCTRSSLPDLMPTARELIASIISRLPGLGPEYATRNAELSMRQDQRRRQEWSQAYAHPAQLPATAAPAALAGRTVDAAVASDTTKPGATGGSAA